jgi:hypothetical protein
MILDDFFARHPNAKGRVIRATVVALRDRGLHLHGFRRRHWVTRRNAVGISFDDAEPYVWLPLDDLEQDLD